MLNLFSTNEPLSTTQPLKAYHMQFDWAPTMIVVNDRCMGPQCLAVVWEGQWVGRTASGRVGTASCSCPTSQKMLLGPQIHACGQIISLQDTVYIYINSYIVVV